MPGANYMGGKRNAAKARSRDATGRIQKGFFGRRRFDMLSKGLASKGPVEEDDALSHPGKGTGDLGLSLAHARNHTDVTTPVQSRSVVLPPTHFPPATPKSKWSGNGASTSSGKGHRSSRVLDVLDTSEPIFRRATLNRILALPDLAGLSGRKKRRRSTEYYEEAGEDDPFVVETPKRQKIPRREPGRKISHMHTPDNILLSPLFASPESSSRHRVHSVLRRETRQGPRRDWDEEDAIDFSDFETRLPGYAHSPEGTTSILGFSPMVEGRDALSSPYDPSVNDHPSSRHNGSQVFLHDELVHLDAHGSQTLSSLPPSSEQPSSISFQPDSQPYWSQDPAATFATPPRVSQDRIHSFPLDNLYDHEDPWHTIGVILGLSPVSPWSRAHAVDGDDLDPVSLPNWTKRSSSLLATDRPQPPELDQDDPLDVGGGELTLIAPDFSDCGTEDELFYIRHLSPGSRLASSAHSKIASAPGYASSVIAECRTPSPRGSDLDIQEEPAVLSASMEGPFKVDTDNIGAESRDNPYLEELENSPTKAQVGSSSPSRTRNSDIPSLTVSHGHDLAPRSPAFPTSDAAFDRKHSGGELGAGSERLLGCSPTASETPVAKDQETSAQKEVFSSTAHSDHDLPQRLTSNLSSDLAIRQSGTGDLSTIPSPLLNDNETVKTCLEKVDGVLQGPCLFPEDWDESEADD